MDSNLPPGVHDWTIPGNRPEDVDEDKFWEVLDDKLRTLHPKVAAFVEEQWDKHDDELVDLARICRDLGYEQGYIDCQVAERG